MRTRLCKLATAVAPVAAWLAAPALAAAATPTLVYDVRVHGTGGKPATVSHVGDSITLDLYAIVNGKNNTLADDGFQGGGGGWTSSKGGLRGDLLGLLPPAPFNA